MQWYKHAGLTKRKGTWTMISPKFSLWSKNPCERKVPSQPVYVILWGRVGQHHVVTVNQRQVQPLEMLLVQIKTKIKMISLTLLQKWRSVSYWESRACPVKRWLPTRNSSSTLQCSWMILTLPEIYVYYDAYLLPIKCRTTRVLSHYIFTCNIELSLTRLVKYSWLLTLPFI